jgi:putative thioredoxin
VFAFKAGRPVDGFMGALPESQIRSFIERLAGKGVFAGSVLEAAQAALDSGDINAAAEGFAAALQQDSDNPEAVAGLARCYLATGDLKRAEQTLALVSASKQNVASIASAKAALALARKGEASGKTDAKGLTAALEKDPDNHQARLDLALALHQKGDKDGALDQLLDIIKRDRTWNDDAARKQLVEFFNAWGPTNPVSARGRQKLSALLFS